MAVLALVGLRLVIGWHFFREGADKIISGDFTSVGFMKASKGPLVPVFRAMIWDGDGRARLDKKAALDTWAQYREQAVQHYGFDAKQAEKTKQKLKYREDQLGAFFKENEEDIHKYLSGLERRDLYRQDAGRMGVASLRGQIEQVEQELSKQLGPWLVTIDATWKGLESDLNGLATKEQAARGRLPLAKPGRRPLDTVSIDQIIPYFDIAVGALLILGLMTRISALAGAGFLATIVATQFPGTPGAQPTHYQIIEMVGLLVLATVGAGRFAGLDYFCNYLRVRCCSPKTEKK